MDSHAVFITSVDSTKFLGTVEQILAQKGCLQAGESTPDNLCVAVSVQTGLNCTSLMLSDPFFQRSQLFSSPNDFFMPLSEAVAPSLLIVLDSDEEETLQYWIYENGSCIDQYHSQHNRFPQEEQDDLRGHPNILARLFPTSDQSTWIEWFHSEDSIPNRWDEFLKRANLGTGQLARKDESKNQQISLVRKYRLPESLLAKAEKPRRLFPWILFAAPAAYLSLRYQAEPTVTPSPQTPTDNDQLPSMHQYLMGSQFHYIGDYLLRIVSELTTFVRLYYRKTDHVHVALSRTESPFDVAWHTEITSHFADESKTTTTNLPTPSPFAIPHRTVYWKPEITAIADLLSFHSSHIQGLSCQKEPRVYCEATYIEEIKNSIRKDYQALLDMRILRKATRTTYGLTWKGAFKMLYHQWQASHQ